MFCPKCGSQIKDGAKFCPKCGANLAALMGARNNMGGPNAGGAPGPARGGMHHPPQRAGQPQGHGQPQQPQGYGQPQGIVPPESYGKQKKFGGLKKKKQQKAFNQPGGFVQPKAKRSPKAVIAIAAVVLIALGGFAAVKFVLGSLGGDETYVVQTDGGFEVTQNLKNEKKYRHLADADEDSYYDTILFSPDKKYVYYYTNIDEGYGTLNRAEAGKLKKDASKNEKYIETIASNVETYGLEFFKDGTFLYKNDGGNLYYYNGKEAEQVAKDVIEYHMDKKDKIIYTVDVGGDEEELYDLYGVDVNDLGNKKKIASDIYSLVLSKDFDNLIFTKARYDENDSFIYTLYSGGFEKETEEVKKNVESYEITSDDKIVYAAYNGNKAILYDYVDDDYKDDELLDDLRADLKSKEYGHPLKNVYQYTDEKETQLAENVTDWCSYRGLIAFNTPDTISSHKVSIEDIYWDFDAAYEVFYFDLANAKYVLESQPDKQLTLNPKTEDDVFGADKDYGRGYYAFGSDVYMLSYDEDSEFPELWKATASDKEIGNAELITEDASVYAADGDSLYYLSNCDYSSDDFVYGDLNVASGGEITTTAKGVVNVNTRIYDDGSVLAYTDYRYTDDDEYGDLALFNKKGEKTPIASDVSEAVRLDNGDVLLISDDNLCLFDGKEPERLRSGVEYFWCSDYMKPISLEYLQTY